MKQKILSCTVLMALVIVASVEGQRLLNATAAAQTSGARTEALNGTDWRAHLYMMAVELVKGRLLGCRDPSEQFLLR